VLKEEYKDMGTTELEVISGIPGPVGIQEAYTMKSTKQDLKSP